MQKATLPIQWILGLFTLLLIQFIIVVPSIYNQLSTHGDIYLNIAYAYELKHSFESLDFFSFLKFYFLEASDHKAQPLSHLMFPLLYIFSDPWILHYGLSILFNLILVGSIFYVLSRSSKSIILPLLFTLCAVNISVSTNRLITFEIILVFSAMFWLIVARLYAAQDIRKVDPCLIIAGTLAFMCRPMDAGIAFIVLYLFFGKTHEILKNKNVICILTLSAVWWAPRLGVLWLHGQQLPRFVSMAVAFTIPQILVFSLAAWDVLLQHKAKRTFISDNLILGLVMANSIICAYFVLRILINDYSIFPDLLLTVTLSYLLCNSPLRSYYLAPMSLLLVVIAFTLVNGGKFNILRLNVPTHWKRPDVFRSGPELANIFKNENISNVTFYYSERVLQNVENQLGIPFNKTQFIHLYLQNSIYANGSYATISWPYRPHILWWFSQEIPNPPAQAFECKTPQEPESRNIVVIDIPSPNQTLNTSVRFFNRYREVTDMAQISKKVRFVSTDTLVEGVTWDTFYGTIDCP